MFLFFLLLPFEYPLQKIGVGSILRYAGLLTMGLAAVDMLHHRIIRVDYRAIILVIWCVYAVFSGLWSVDKSNYSRYVSMYVNNTLMFIMISLVPYKDREREFIEKGFVGGVLLLLLYMTFIPGAVVSSSWQSRLTLAYKGKELLDQNYLAAIMLMPYGCQLFDLIEKKQRRWIKILVCGFILFYILRTGSRSGILGAGVITLFCLLRGAQKKERIVYVLVFCVLLVGPWIIQLLPSNLLDRFSLKAMTGNTSESSARLEIWTAAWNAIKNSNIFFGYGAGSSEYLMGLHYTRNAAIHNFYIAHVLELGLVGLALFGTVLIKMLGQMKLFGEEKLCIAFLGIVVEGFFLDMLTTKFFWGAMMMVTISISAGKCMRRETESLQPAL